MLFPLLPTLLALAHTHTHTYTRTLKHFGFPDGVFPKEQFLFGCRQSGGGALNRSVISVKCKHINDNQNAITRERFNQAGDV